ncbi:MAG TPA: cytochrome-c oxidase, partial [Planctomycetes bacterium]|nr:cytochrome-c oxidase [Planctomycetota bacterium]
KEPTPAAYAEALRLGRDVYIDQACWHCHSQYVREVSNEAQRFGPPGTAQEYQNGLNQPHLWGTRRVGPDLSRENGKRPNDWHIAHLIHPKNVVPTSVMPNYPWYFSDEGVPTKKGFGLVSYIQWLGTTQVKDQ